MPMSHGLDVYLRDELIASNSTGRAHRYPTIRFNREPRLQQSFGVELFRTRGVIKIDSHGHALHDLDVVTCCVFWRQQAENRTRASAHVRYAALPLAAIGIHLDLDALARAHVLKLRFLEIRRHPNIIERHNILEFLSDAHVLSHFDTSLANNSRHGREDHGIAEVHLCLCKLSLTLQRLGIGSLRVGASQQNLLRCSFRGL